MRRKIWVDNRALYAHITGGVLLVHRPFIGDLPLSRPRSDHLIAEKKLSIAASLSARIDLFLLDPLTRKPKYGEWSRLTALFWEDYLSRQRREDNVSSSRFHLPNVPNTTFVLSGREFTFDELVALTTRPSS